LKQVVSKPQQQKEQRFLSRQHDSTVVSVEMNNDEGGILLKQIKQLRANEARYKSFFTNASFPIFVLDPKLDTILEMNEQAERFLGYSKKELLKMKKLPFVPPTTMLRDLMNWGIRLNNVASLRRKDGEILDVEMTAGIVDQNVDSKENPALILYLKDVTEERRLREQLVQAEKMSLLGRLSAGIAHEIRNPLTAVKINLQEFDSVTQPQSPLRQSLNLALEGVEQIEQIIESTLEFARPTKPDRQLANLNEILEKSFSFVKPILAKKNVQVSFRTTPNLPYVKIDYRQIQQVFLNLLTNAIDASSFNGLIEVTTALEKNLIAASSLVLSESRDDVDLNEMYDYIIVEFKDFGIGISNEQIDHIFEPFFTTKQKGTGLGLAICKQILDMHSAFITVLSLPNRGGTSFACYFPVNENGTVVK
jgi:two-component system nitrogen regulation sensor histidine kinase GlnL